MRQHLSWLAAMLTATAGCAGEHARPRVGEHGASLAGGASARAAPAFSGPFVVSTARSFQDLMDEAMARMHSGMEGAPRTGDADRDFVTQMIPHHQGAIDMARVLLVYGKDPGLQRLAKEIITDQQSEIDLMRAWLDAHAQGAPKSEAP